MECLGSEYPAVLISLITQKKSRSPVFQLIPSDTMASLIPIPFDFAQGRFTNVVPRNKKSLTFSG
jgi:hypothetical protein